MRDKQLIGVCMNEHYQMQKHIFVMSLYSHSPVPKILMNDNLVIKTIRKKQIAENVKSREDSIHIYIKYNTRKSDLKCDL